jgi:hypothetical protein
MFRTWRRIIVIEFERDGLAVELLDRSSELVAPASFRTLIAFIAIDVVAESRTFGPVRTIGALTAYRAFRPLMQVTLTAYVAPTSQTIGLDTGRAARAGVDDLDVTIFAVKAVAIGARRKGCTRASASTTAAASARSVDVATVIDIDICIDVLATDRFVLRETVAVA